MDAKFVIFVIMTFLLVTVICSSVPKSEVFAKKRLPATATSCVIVKPTKSGAVYAEKCCDTTTYFNDAGQATHSSTECQVCQWSGGGGLIDCSTVNGLNAVPPLPNAGAKQPPSTSEQSNNTNVLEGKVLKHSGALKGGEITPPTNSNDTLQ